ncbi:MAG TPA: preprotein translocase subunit SecE [Gelria sp.]|nr:preprotein translocase subunit SecE [Gelria sp.]
MVSKTKNVPAKKENGGLKLRWENTKQYFISVYNELKKVHWPDRQQLVAYTGVVLFAVTLVALIIWVFDLGLSFLITKLFEAFA